MDEIKVTKEMIEVYRRERVSEFVGKVMELCNEYNCDIVAFPSIEDGKIIANLTAKMRD